jgi:subtilisin-like proprotein convertase family protein
MNSITNNRRMSRHPLAALTLGFTLLAGSSIASAQLEGQETNRLGWSFSHEVNGNQEGLSLKNVYFNGHKLLAKISMPVMRVFYQTQCGGSPFADRLGSTLATIPWANNALLAKREFTTPDGRRWFEIGIRDEIGHYNLYQAFYLSSDGIIDAHAYGKGLQCVIDHEHYPNWRIDLDVDGSSNDVVERNTGAGFTSLATEFSLNAATQAVNHAFRVRDTVTGTKVDVLPGFPDFAIPDGGPGTIPTTAYNKHTVFGRVYKSTEDIGWTFGPLPPYQPHVPYGEGESIAAKDAVLWYEGYLPHKGTEPNAVNVWHSTGVRLVSNLGTVVPPVGTNWPFANTASITIPNSGSGAPYPSTINVTGVTGTVKKVKVEINSLNHTWPDDIDMVLVGPGGQAVKLMSDVGDAADVVNVNLTLDSTAIAPLPAGKAVQLVSGVFMPTDVGSTDNFPAPAPAGANTAGTNLSVFNGVAPNGAWKLYVVDDTNNDLGNVAGGWKLTLTTQ